MQKILIVEDDLAIQALLHDFIQEAGYEVTLASDGVEALSYFSERSFDLVLLDIMLPKSTATECVKLSGENQYSYCYAHSFGSRRKSDQGIRFRGG